MKTGKKSFVGTISELRVKIRLDYLREQIEAECVSYSEIVELQGLVEYIEPEDNLLLEWAGVPENICQKGCAYHTQNNECTEYPN
jgi:hypothetical protein